LCAAIGGYRPEADHEFTDTVIARMIPIGQMLRQSLKGG